MTEQPEITPDMAGTWLEGAHGWHNAYRVIDRAVEYGLKLSADFEAMRDLYASGDHDATVKLSDGETVAYDGASEWINGLGGLSELATDHLQGLAPEGLTFVWDAGELILTADSELD